MCARWGARGAGGALPAVSALITASNAVQARSRGSLYRARGARGTCAAPVAVCSFGAPRWRRAGTQAYGAVAVACTGRRGPGARGAGAPARFVITARTAYAAAGPAAPAAAPASNVQYGAGAPRRQGKRLWRVRRAHALARSLRRRCAQVAVLTLNRPNTRNALCDQLVRELNAALHAGLFLFDF